MTAPGKSAAGDEEDGFDFRRASDDDIATLGSGHRHARHLGGRRSRAQRDLLLSESLNLVLA
jgi:hypothetical protein